MEVLIVLAVVVVALSVSTVMRERAFVQHDPRRDFSPSERAEIFRRCNGRCEHKSPWWRRCRGAATHADHVYPWSRGGATQLSNAQGLCAWHNLSKGARPPSPIEIWRLERRRRSYFPEGVPTRIERR